MFSLLKIVRRVVLTLETKVSDMPFQDWTIEVSIGDPYRSFPLCLACTSGSSDLGQKR